MVASAAPRVLVAGSGPAGLAIASALASRGADVRVVSPSADTPWPATYGCWADEADALGFGDCLAHRWDRVVAWGRTRHELGRSYAVFDNERLRRRLSEGLNGRIERGTLDRPADGELMVDARGHVPAASPVLQTAYGIRLTPSAPPEQPGTCVLMDWRPADSGPATFLYALDLGDRWLLEETSLAARGGHATVDLRRRLLRRAGLASSASDDTEVEHVSFPMLTHVPRRPDGVVLPFGARAGFVNPATGYSVIASLARAEPVADALITTMADGAEHAALAGWHAAWPPAARRSLSLRRFGLRALMRMNAGELADFFDAFFGLPPATWRAYMSTDASPAEIMRTMRAVFAASPWRVRRRLMLAGWLPAA